jgi:hypothetical protein
LDVIDQPQYHKCTKKQKKLYERERRKSLVILWLTNVTNHNVTQVLPNEKTTTIKNNLRYKKDYQIDLEKKCLTTIIEFFFIFLWEMLTCALKAQVNDSNIEKNYWNVCIAFNI